MRTMLVTLALIVFAAFVPPSQAVMPPVPASSQSVAIKVLAPVDHKFKIGQRRDMSAPQIAVALCKTSLGSCIVAGPGYCECCFKWFEPTWRCASGTAS